MVIGLGRFGTSVAHTLFQMGFDVLAIDTDERVVQANLGLVTYSVQGDATNETILRELGAPNFDAAIVAVGSDMQASLMTSVLLATLGVPLIAARAENRLHGDTLRRIGVHKIIYPEQEMGEFLAHSLFNQDVLEYMDLTPEFGLSKLRISDTLENYSLRNAGLGGGARDKYGMAVVAIRRGKEVTLAPDEDEVLRRGDILVVAARSDQLERWYSLNPDSENGAD